MSRLSFCLLLVLLTLVTCGAYQHFKQEWVLFRQGEQFFKNRQYPEAQAFFSQAWDRGLRCPPLVMAFHETLLAAGTASQAWELTRQFIREGGELALLEPITDLYFSYVQKDFVSFFATELAQRYPHNRLALFTAARLFSRLGQFEEAARQYRQGLGDSTP